MSQPVSERKKRSSSYASLYFAERPGFQSVNVTHDTLTSSFHNAAGDVLYSVQISRRERVFLGDDKILGLHGMHTFSHIHTRTRTPAHKRTHYVRDVGGHESAAARTHIQQHTLT